MVAIVRTSAPPEDLVRPAASIAKSIDPRLVRMNEMRAAGKVANTDGIDGDPSRSSAELGRPAIEAVVAKTVAAIRRATQR